MVKQKKMGLGVVTVKQLSYPGFRVRGAMGGGCEAAVIARS